MLTDKLNPNVELITSKFVLTEVGAMTNWQLLLMLIQTCSLAAPSSPLYLTLQKKFKKIKKDDITTWTRRSSETISEDATCFGQSATKLGQALLYFLLVTLLQIIVNPCNPLVWVFLLICEFVTSIERSLMLFKHSTTKTTTSMKAMLSKKKNASAWCVTVWQIKILNILCNILFTGSTLFSANIWDTWALWNFVIFSFIKILFEYLLCNNLLGGVVNLNLLIK